MAPIPTSQKLAIEILRRRFGVSVKSDAPRRKSGAAFWDPWRRAIFARVKIYHVATHAPKRAPQGCYLRHYPSAGNFFKSASRRNK